MARTLLAVGSWSECERLIACAMSNGWSALHTERFEEVGQAMERINVDLILITGRASDEEWERAAATLRSVRREAPIVTLRSPESQDSLVSALGCAPPELATSRKLRRVLASRTQTYRRSELMPGVTYIEPSSHLVPIGIQQAIDFIKDHYSEPITLADAASAASCCRAHFCKLFKQSLGISFLTYLYRIRIRRAVDLLVHSDTPVTNIAYEVGFNDLTNFERVFRALLRHSPSQYRQLAKYPQTIADDSPSLSLPAVAL